MPPFPSDHALLDTVHAMVFVQDLENRYRFVNREWERTFDRRREDVIGRTVSEVLGPDLGARIAARNAQVLASPAPVTTELTVPTANGPRILFIERRLMHESNGVTPLVCGVGTDITVLRAEESARHALEARLQQAQELESLGRMAGGVAHDFNNLLTGVLGNVEVALAELPADSAAAATVLRIQCAAERAASLARHMLAYAGQAAMRSAPVDLGGLVARLREPIVGALGGGVRLAVEVEPALPAVAGDEGHLEQVVMNLVLNAGESLAGRPGAVSVRVARARIDAQHPCECVTGSRCSDGDHVRLEVKDDGVGMDAETRRHVFDPFFTTKFAGRGLGLSAVLGIVRAHGGGIAIDSAPGSGSRFQVYLPALASAAPGHVAQRPAGAVAEDEAGRCVLVVDDERSVLELACEALARGGFDALAAGDGAAALAHWRERRGEIGLVIADMAMPRMTGPELLAELRALDPGLPVVLMSGYAGAHPGFDSDAGAAAAVLEKPFRIAELLALVRRTIREPAKP